MSQTYLFFDTETNGLPRDYQAPPSTGDNWPRLLQLAWVLANDEGVVIAQESDLIWSLDYELDMSAAAVHGLTMERLLREGLVLEDSLQEFTNSLSKADAIVAHNLPFDLAVISSEFLREDAPDVLEVLRSKEQICTMKESTAFCAIPSPYKAGKFKWPRLNELHQKLFNEGFGGAHDAMNDVEAMMRCFWELKARGVIK